MLWHTLFCTINCRAFVVIGRSGGGLFCPSRLPVDRSRFDPEDVTSDLEIVVSQAKMNNNPKAREYECVLDQIQKHSKSLSRIGLKDLFVTLIGDPAKSNVLERSN